jgi:thiamine-monophosphate kinase
VIGYITEPAEGKRIITKGGSVHDITAQGWNAFK